MQIELEPVAQNLRGRPGEIDDRRPTEVVKKLNSRRLWSWEIWAVDHTEPGPDSHLSRFPLVFQ